MAFIDDHALATFYGITWDQHSQFIEEDVIATRLPAEATYMEKYLKQIYLNYSLQDNVILALLPRFQSLERVVIRVLSLMDFLGVSWRTTIKELEEERRKRWSKVAEGSGLQSEKSCPAIEVKVVNVYEPVYSDLV